MMRCSHFLLASFKSPQRKSASYEGCVPLPKRLNINFVSPAILTAQLHSRHCEIRYRCGGSIDLSHRSEVPVMKRIFVAPFFPLLVAWISPASTQPLPPADMIWKTESGTCTPSTGDIDGCSFGPASSAYKSGVAYFRVCGQLHEARPFLIVDTANRKFLLDRRNGRPLQTWPFRHGSSDHTPKDVANFASMVEDKYTCLAV